MRANISIKTDGITQPSVKPAPPDGGERSVSELEAIISNLSQSALSQHLCRLRRANIVRTRLKSQTVYYSVEDTDPLRSLRLLSHTYNHDPVIRLRRHSTHLYLTHWHSTKKNAIQV